MANQSDPLLEVRTEYEVESADALRFRQFISEAAITPVSALGIVLNVVVVWVWSASKGVDSLHFFFKAQGVLDVLFLVSCNVYLYTEGPMRGISQEVDPVTQQTTFTKKQSVANVVSEAIFFLCRILVVNTTLAITTLRVVSVMYPLSPHSTMAKVKGVFLTMVTAAVVLESAQVLAQMYSGSKKESDERKACEAVFWIVEIVGLCIPILVHLGMTIMLMWEVKRSMTSWTTITPSTLNMVDVSPGRTSQEGLIPGRPKSVPKLSIPLLMVESPSTTSVVKRSPIPGGSTDCTHVIRDSHSRYATTSTSGVKRKTSRHTHRKDKDRDKDREKDKRKQDESALSCACDDISVDQRMAEMREGARVNWERSRKSVQEEARVGMLMDMLARTVPDEVQSSEERAQPDKNADSDSDSDGRVKDEEVLKEFRQRERVVRCSLAESVVFKQCGQCKTCGTYTCTVVNRCKRCQLLQQSEMAAMLQVALLDAREEEGQGQSDASQVSSRQSSEYHQDYQHGNKTEDQNDEAARHEGQGQGQMHEKESACTCQSTKPTKRRRRSKHHHKRHRRESERPNDQDDEDDLEDQPDLEDQRKDSKEENARSRKRSRKHTREEQRQQDGDDLDKVTGKRPGKVASGDTKQAAQRKVLPKISILLNDDILPDDPSVGSRDRMKQGDTRSPSQDTTDSRLREGSSDETAERSERGENVHSGQTAVEQRAKPTPSSAHPKSGRVVKESRQSLHFAASHTVMGKNGSTRSSTHATKRARDGHDALHEKGDHALEALTEQPLQEENIEKDEPEKKSDDDDDDEECAKPACEAKSSLLQRSTSRSSKQDFKIQRARRTTLAVIVISLLSFVAYPVSVASSMYFHFNPDPKVKAQRVVSETVEFLLQVINSSVNFLVYYLLLGVFRKLFWKRMTVGTPRVQVHQNQLGDLKAFPLVDFKDDQPLRHRKRSHHHRRHHRLKSVEEAGKEREEGKEEEEEEENEEEKEGEGVRAERHDTHNHHHQNPDHHHQAQHRPHHHQHQQHQQQERHQQQQPQRPHRHRHQQPARHHKVPDSYTSLFEF